MFFTGNYKNRQTFLGKRVDTADRGGTANIEAEIEGPLMKFSKILGFFSAVFMEANALADRGAAGVTNFQ